MGREVPLGEVRCPAWKIGSRSPYSLPSTHAPTQADSALSFEFARRPGWVPPESLTKLPFQSQIRFTRRDGARLVRVQVSVGRRRRREGEGTPHELYRATQQHGRLFRERRGLLHLAA